MAKLTLYISRFFSMLLVLSIVYNKAAAQYKLMIKPVDQDSVGLRKVVTLQSNFRNRLLCETYLNGLPADLLSRGYPTASVDSILYDSSFASAQLYLGQKFQVAGIRTEGIDKKLLEASGWRDKAYLNKPLSAEELAGLQNRLLNFLENNGYPFARVQLDSIVFQQEKLYAQVKIEKGPLYKIDSIRVTGKAKISNSFLQRYLDIQNGTIYQKEKLQSISKKILELPYLEEQQNWNLTMLGTGSILNLYLKPKKSSQVNVLVGLLPANTQTLNNKILITGEANINLRNALGNGETIGLNWQQIQVKSPRLDLSFQQPYLFGSPFGVAASFNLLKKDSSYINLWMLLGLQYKISTNQTSKIFIESRKTNLLYVDTAYIKSTKKLPDEMDVSSVNLGLDYDFNNTNFRFNPRSGSELRLTISAGTRKVRKNNIILKLYDTAFSYASLYDTIKESTYQFTGKLMAAHYFPLGVQSTIKTSLTGALFQTPSAFRNELFQIGGYKLLRGFDEESIFASAYAVGTVEYRYLIGLNSYLFTFLDGGFVANKSQGNNTKNGYIGFGAGMAFETKAGIFNISYAAGKRDDNKLDLRQSKIHLGYINFF